MNGKNPLIVNTFLRSGYIEAWGRGIQKIKDSCIMAGNDIPEYSVKKEDFRNTILVRVFETEIDDETVWIDLVIWQR